MSAGWYLMHRGWMASPDFKPEPLTEREAFLWSIEQAAHRAHGQWFNGVQYPVERGEFVTSLHSMMTAFDWSEKRVRGFRDRMIRCGKWAKRGANAGAKAPHVLTVCNYGRFQARGKAKGEAEGEAKGEPGAKQGRSEGEEQKEGITNGNEFEGKESGSRTLAVQLPFDDALAAWSEIAAIKKWTPVKPKLSQLRRSRLGKILSADGLDGWISALQKAADSDWLGGPAPPACANFDFFIHPEKFMRLQEGSYDRSFNKQSSGAGSAWLDARENMLHRV